jgi:Zn-dependent alcohol dehydrogenase
MGFIGMILLQQVPIALRGKKDNRGITVALTTFAISVGKKFDANHIAKCTKRTKPQVNAIVVNDLGVDLTEETLNQLEIEDAMIAEIGHLSLNALAGTEEGDSMRLMTLVQDKVIVTSIF